jgi:hypothetical protein
MKFDIDAYKTRTARLDDHDIDYDAFRDRPLDPATLRTLRYMHDVEHHTVCYLRDLLVTPAHHDPDMTTFLTFWAYEEFWHGEAIGKVLAAHDEPSGRVRVAAVRARHRVKQVLAPIGTMLTSGLTNNFTAVHMTWGAVNEWCTQAGYARLRTRADHPVLGALLDRIMRQEGRHIDFYSSQAHERLEGNRGAQVLTRLALRRFWAPVGSTIMPRAEVAHVTRHLFTDDEGRNMGARIDRRIDRLPGLSGLQLISSAIDRYTARAA